VERSAEPSLEFGAVGVDEIDPLAHAPEARGWVGWRA
jgi:hypothetical protein